MIINGFDWDKGNWPKCSKHGLFKHEIEEVLKNDPFILADRSLQSDETRFNAVGKISSDRYVFIVFTLRDRAGNRLIRPISARYMHQKEVERYERHKQA